MQLSECCNERVLPVTAREGWWFGETLMFEWHECTICKKKCNVITKGAKDEQ